NRSHRNQFLSLIHSFEPSLVGGGFVAGLDLTLVERSVADHGKEDAQQTPAHGDVGLGLGHALDQTLANRFLFGVGSAKNAGGLAQRPAKGGAAGRGNRTRLSSA